jgi:hypothetical protein
MEGELNTHINVNEMQKSYSAFDSIPSVHGGEIKYSCWQ